MIIHNLVTKCQEIKTKNTHISFFFFFWQIRQALSETCAQVKNWTFNSCTLTLQREVQIGRPHPQLGTYYHHYIQLNMNSWPFEHPTPTSFTMRLVPQGYEPLALILVFEHFQSIKSAGKKKVAQIIQHIKTQNSKPIHIWIITFNLLIIETMNSIWLSNEITKLRNQSYCPHHHYQCLLENFYSGNSWAWEQTHWSNSSPTFAFHAMENSG